MKRKQIDETEEQWEEYHRKTLESSTIAAVRAEIEMDNLYNEAMAPSHRHEHGNKCGSCGKKCSPAALKCNLFDAEHVPQCSSCRN
jgi:hypothetical protein